MFRALMFSEVEVADGKRQRVIGMPASEIAGLEVWQAALFFSPAPTEPAHLSAAERSFLARQRGEPVPLIGIDVNADTPMAAAVRAAREARKREQAEAGEG